MIVFNTSNITFICFSFLHFAFISHLSRSIFRYIPCYFYPFFNIQILIVIGTYITLHLTSISLYLHINYSLIIQKTYVFGNTFPKGVIDSYIILNMRNLNNCPLISSIPLNGRHTYQGTALVLTSLSHTIIL